MTTSTESSNGAGGLVSAGVDTGPVQMSLFDYAQLDEATAIIVKARTAEIKEHVQAIRHNSIEVGRKLIEVKDRLGHGQFGDWLAAEFQWSNQTAQNFMNVARLVEQNPNYLEFEDRFAKTALTVLAQPSTPEVAKQEAVARAEMGEEITAGKAKEIVERRKRESSSRKMNTDAPSKQKASEELQSAAAKTPDNIPEIFPGTITEAKTIAVPDNETCRVCGCTDTSPCEDVAGMCAWVEGEPNLCTRCKREIDESAPGNNIPEKSQSPATAHIMRAESASIETPEVEESNETVAAEPANIISAEETSPPITAVAPAGWNEATITLTLTLLPHDGDELGRPALLGLRYNDDPPAMKTRRETEIFNGRNSFDVNALKLCLPTPAAEMFLALLQEAPARHVAKQSQAAVTAAGSKPSAKKPAVRAKSPATKSQAAKKAAATTKPTAPAKAKARAKAAPAAQGGK